MSPKRNNLQKDAWRDFQQVRGIYFEREDFRETLDGGQAFTWYANENDSPEEPEYEGFFGTNLARLHLDSQGKVWASFPKVLDAKKGMRELELYLDCQRDYEHIRKTLESTQDTHMSRALQTYPTLRILRQNPAEAIVAFICSSSKRIVQIKQCVKLLAQNLGKEICEGFYSLPNFEEIDQAPIETITECKLGFRARYLKNSARKIVADNFEPMKLRQLDYHSAKAYLTNLSGIGEKVADCILLFGASRFEAFPVDTWIKQAMHKLYNTGEKPEHIRAFASDKFGEYAGFAQQLIFASIRNGK